MDGWVAETGTRVYMQTPYNPIYIQLFLRDLKKPTIHSFFPFSLSLPAIPRELQFFITAERLP